jgi:RND family efflux transporter MFP subunit
LNRSTVARTALALALGLCPTGCRREKPPPPPPPPAVVTVARPVAFPVQAYYEYNGNLDAIETVQITARVKGFLQEIRFTEGTEVKQGDLLFKIDPRDHQATVKRGEADRLKAVAELKRARSDEDRVKSLRGSGSVSEEDFAQRVAARETAEAVVKQAEAAVEAARLELSYTEIHAPIAGQISRTHVTRGNLVGQGDPTLLTTIVSMNPLYIYFDVPERDLVEYQRTLLEAPPPGGTPSAPVEVGVATETGYPHKGRVDFRENRVDMGTGTIRIRGRIPNPRVPPANARLLYPGLFARVRVPAGDPRSLPAIPEDALMTGQEGQFVYVLGEKDVVQKRTVTVGPQVYKALPAEGQPPGWTLGQGDKDQPVPSVVAIEKGLTPEDRVIVNGLTKARPGSPVAPQVWELRPPAAK